MGPEFSLQRAVWIRGQMIQEPTTAAGGDCDIYAPNDPRHKARPWCVVGRPDCNEGCDSTNEDES